MKCPLLHILATAAVLGVLLTSCRHDGAERLSEGEFVSTYVRLAMAETTPAVDSIAAIARADSVLAKSGVTREQMKATAEWYSKDVTRWKGVFEHIATAMRESTEAAVWR